MLDVTRGEHRKFHYDGHIAALIRDLQSGVVRSFVKWNYVCAAVKLAIFCRVIMFVYYWDGFIFGSCMGRFSVRCFIWLGTELT